MKYLVTYGFACERRARFSNYDDAMGFARSVDGEVYLTRGKATGIIGQFKNGRATGEFRHLDAAHAA